MLHIDSMIGGAWPKVFVCVCSENMVHYIFIRDKKYEMHFQRSNVLNFIGI